MKLDVLERPETQLPVVEVISLHYTIVKKIYSKICGYFRTEITAFKYVLEKTEGTLS